MFSHVMVGASDLQKTKVFYDALMSVLGNRPGTMDDKGRCFYFSKDGTFAFTTPINGEPATCANGGTIGFKANSAEMVNEWYETGIAHGGSACEDPPGVRSLDIGDLYLAYLRDPSGNKICALYQGA